ncbi:MAG: translation initiation factor IF-2 [Rikenellaceae bacterium]
MSEQKKVRLSAMARTFSTGAHHLVDYLNSKGLGEGVNPNTILSSEQIAVLNKEFGGSEPVEKLNVREVMRSAATAQGVEMPKEPKVDSKTPTHKPTEVFKAKVLGKINLDAPAKGVVAEDAPQSPKQEVEVPVTSEPKKEEVAVAQEPKISEEAQRESAPQQEEKEAKEAKEAKEVALAENNIENIAPKQQEPALDKPKVEEPKAESKEEVEEKVKPAVQVTEEVKETNVKSDAAEVSTKDAAPSVSGEVFRANKAEKLSGPKILGKITLPTPSESNSGGGRGKRNRIKKNKVDISKGGQNGGGQNGGGARTQHQGGGNNQGSNASQQSGGARQQNQGGGGNQGSRPQNHGGQDRRGPGNNANPNRGRQRPKPIVREQVSDEDVQKQVRETLAKLTNKGQKTKSSKYRRDKRDAVQGRMAEEAEKLEQNSGVLQLTEFVTVQELATMMDASINDVIASCMNLGLMVSINQRLDAEALAIVAEEFGFNVEFVSVEIQEAIDQEEDKEEDLISRPPIVTVMGHVDHGKTSLLDHIRKTNVIAGEAGGITQHIGAYSVKLEDGRRVTFLDTPGHEAFTAMRARGAKITDVAVIIVAADDAIMPQTKEAINHAEAAGVPIVFAINKVDKDGANPEKIKEQLSIMNYLVEDWGGKYQSEDISAKKGMGVDKLLEKIVLESELLDLKANPNRKASGSVIESSLDKGRGYVTTVLVQNGTLRIGDVLLSGIYTGRVKAMFNERGKKITEAGPATPVLVLGLNGAPQAGDMFNVMDDDKAARDIANKREQLARMQGLRTQKHITLDEIGRRIAIGSFKELNIIVKGDVDGSIEALTGSLIKLSTEEVQVNVIHKAVGAVSESDILLAAASNAVIVGFQVRPSAAARRLAEKEEIDIRLYSIIYDAINEIKDAIEGMLAPDTKEEITSSVEVLETFKISKVGTIAGCIVREGKVTRGNAVRVIRDGIVVYTGKLNSLKRFKDEVKEVNVNVECGLAIENYNDIKVGDIVESYTIVEVARKL